MILAFLFPVFTIMKEKQQKGIIIPTLGYYSYNEFVALNIVSYKYGKEALITDFKEKYNKGIEEESIKDAFNVNQIVKETNIDSEVIPLDINFNKSLINSEKDYDDFLIGAKGIRNIPVLVEELQSVYKIEPDVLRKLLSINSQEQFNDLITGDSLSSKDYTNLERASMLVATMLLTENKFHLETR